MAIPSHFQDAVNLVDATKVLTWTLDTSYGAMEWSYSGLNVKGGSEAAIKCGLSALLDAMGFRFYTPRYNAVTFPTWKLPASIATNLTAIRQFNFIQAANLFLVYGHSWAGSAAASRDVLLASQAKWAALNGVDISRYPVGHRWAGIRDSGTGPSFFQAHPELLRFNVGTGGQKTLDVRNNLPGSANYIALTEYCAARLLAEGLNEFSETHFDAIDGDSHTSDEVWPFVKAVNDKMRAGTSLITWNANGASGSLAAQTAVPTAKIGAYAYAGHRIPPAASYSPAYCQVALAFNNEANTGFNYEELVAGHAAKASAIALREYTDTEVWSHGYPANNARAKVGYFARYNSFQSGGAIGVNSEHTAHWFINIMQARWAVRKWRTGVLDEDAIIQEVVADIFDDDPAVLALYRFWHKVTTVYNVLTLKRTFDYVDDMADGWYKIHFQRLCAIWYLDHKLMNYSQYGYVVSPTNLAADTYLADRKKWAGWVTGVRDDDIMHSYAQIRQRMNTALTTAPFNYPGEKFNSLPEPSWYTTLAVKPTVTDFNDAYTAIQVDAARPAYVDDIEDLVMVRVTPPTAMPGDKTSVSSNFHINGPAQLYFFGPGTVTIRGWVSSAVAGDLQSEQTYGSGMHVIDVTGNISVTNTGGRLFALALYGFRRDASMTSTGNKRLWMYAPTQTAGSQNIAATSRVSLWDELATRADWGVAPPASPRADTVTVGGKATFPNIGPGVIAVDDVNTTGAWDNKTLNVFLSQDPRLQLMPRTLADAEGFGGIRIKKAA